MIKQVLIKNFKTFHNNFKIQFSDGLNIIVGNNEAGKTTILEAIHLALSGIYRGNYIGNNLSQYIFNKQIIDDYITNINEKNNVELPEMLIEIYFENNSYPKFEGSNYSDKTLDHAEGIGMRICFDDSYKSEYNSLLEQVFKEEKVLTGLPIEYYKVERFSFSRDERITNRTIPLKVSLIDSSSYSNADGSDIYINNIIRNILSTEDTVKISQEYREIIEDFSTKESINQINTKLNEQSLISNKEVKLGVNLGTNNDWNKSLIANIGNIPFSYIGKGEQAIWKTMLSLSSIEPEQPVIILIEEPENHLSHTNLNRLINNISKNSFDNQIIITTHSSYVINKLGLKNIILLNNPFTTTFNNLTEDTQDFFKKISGYDSLRFLLANKALLVEGDSDELILQKAYLDETGKLPIEDGFEIISVGTSFLRFLELAESLNTSVGVVTDNDGDIEKNILEKYKKYLIDDQEHIEVFYEKDEYSDIIIQNSNEKSITLNNNTLEATLLRVNGLSVTNSIISKEFETIEKNLNYMLANKTTVALNFFNSSNKIEYPPYIKEAIDWLIN